MVHDTPLSYLLIMISNLIINMVRMESKGGIRDGYNWGCDRCYWMNSWLPGCGRRHRGYGC